MTYKTQTLLKKQKWEKDMWTHQFKMNCENQFMCWEEFVKEKIRRNTMKVLLLKYYVDVSG